MTDCDLLILGSGYFAEVMLNDIAATAKKPVKVIIGGRNLPRMKWLVTAANARAAMFGTHARFESAEFDMASTQTIADGLSRFAPKVVVQSASLQSPWKVDGRDSKWAALVNDAGFGFTLALQAMLPTRTARALKESGSKAIFVNTCYPDVVNQVIKAQGLPITCGVGNIAIFSSIAKSVFDPQGLSSVKVLGHHNHLVDWRKPAADRTQAPVRVWVDDVEQQGILERFRDVQLPFRDLNVISGGSAVPVLLALAGTADCASHVPGPAGRPGGYPVKVSAGKVELDLPRGLGESDAVAWNLHFEQADGASVIDRKVVYSSRAREAIAQYDSGIADGFHVEDLSEAYARVSALRERLGG